MSGLALRTLSLAGSALLLAGCGASSSPDAGGAAARSRIGDIGQQELIAQVQAFQSEVGLPVNQPAPGLARATLERMLQDKLIKAKADALGITVTQGQIDDGVAALASQNGGESGLADAAHSSGLAVGAVTDLVRSNLYVAAIGKELAPGADNTTAVMAVQKSIVEMAANADVRVAPRYGVWHSETLSIDPASTVTKPLTESTPPVDTPNPATEPGSPQDTASPAAQPTQPAPASPTE